jgi:hypothetical protein
LISGIVFIVTLLVIEVSETAWDALPMLAGSSPWHGQEKISTLLALLSEKTKKTPVKVTATKSKERASASASLP